NLNYTVPRRADVAWLAANGYTRSRLPIKWEMLQPMLHDTNANAAARALIGEPGAFDAAYQSFIAGVLDAHAAAGIRCVIDLHNYCRYRDFVFQPDGSVIGLERSTNPLLAAYTWDNTQVWERIFALAPGATLKQSNFTDFWTRVARLWKDHPGFGGYGLMNEPYWMPGPGSIEPSWGASEEDLSIWATYAQAAITAIRAVDPAGPIYLGGNDWSAAMYLATRNPAWPLTGANLIYEVHMYLDAGSNGQHFDYDTEVALGYSAGFQTGPIDRDTGVERLEMAVDWAKPRGLKLALTETGMPIDDPRWEEMWKRLLNYARANGVDVYSWNGGNHWTVRNAAINMVPGWHQNKTLEPSASGVMKASAGIGGATLHDDGPGWAGGGGSVTITVYARGNLASALTLTVASSNGGTLSKSILTIPAGANGQDQFTFTPRPDSIATLSYTVASLSLASPPPPRKVYSLTDPVSYAATSVAEAAMAILAKYGACKWELADGYTDFMQGAPAAAGQQVRAISDSGYGSAAGNSMEMLNWVNDSPAMGAAAPPVMRVTNGKKHSDHSYSNTWGLWCKKTLPVPQVQANPRNRTPYGVQDPHFAIAAVSLPGVNNGIVFQASSSSQSHASELLFNNSRAQFHCIDQQGTAVLLTSATALPANQPAVVSYTSVPGAQRLRINSTVVDSSSATFGASPCDQLLIGMGFTGFYPRSGFNGNIYSVITGKGAPTVQELGVLERYLGSTAGL
ncbi:MAG: cellulase family glycosylhydrolase, partial [Ramlibacter sp.]